MLLAQNVHTSRDDTLQEYTYQVRHYEIAWSQVNTFYRRCELFASHIEAARQLKPSFFNEHHAFVYKDYAMGRLVNHAENPS